MLTPEDLERERQWAREKLERDQLSRLHSAYEEGLELGEWIGAIHALQDLLHRSRTPKDRLRVLPLEELQALAQQLREEVAK